MIELNNIKTRRRTESLDEFTSMLQEGDTNDTYVMMIRKLKEDYEKQIETLINRLKILSGKYKNNLDLDIHSK
jgi:precorrin-3B methylase